MPDSKLAPMKLTRAELLAALSEQLETVATEYKALRSQKATLQREIDYRKERIALIKQAIKVERERTTDSET